MLHYANMASSHMSEQALCKHATVHVYIFFLTVINRALYFISVMSRGAVCISSRSVITFIYLSFRKWHLQHLQS